MILKKFRSGTIRIEPGADGTYVLFDCDCLDALPYCNAHCCCLSDIDVESGEFVTDETTWDEERQIHVMKHRPDGWCVCNALEDRRCMIYDRRPKACREFHCTRGPMMRGWRLALNRLPEGMAK